MVLQLEIEILGTEDVRVVPGGRLGVLRPSPEDALVDLPLEAGREADEALGVLA